MTGWTYCFGSNTVRIVNLAFFEEEPDTGYADYQSAGK